MRNPTTGLASLYRGVTLEWIDLLAGCMATPLDEAVRSRLYKSLRPVQKRQTIGAQTVHRLSTYKGPL